MEAFAQKYYWKNLAGQVYPWSEIDRQHFALGSFLRKHRQSFPPTGAALPAEFLWQFYFAEDSSSCSLLYQQNTVDCINLKLK